MSSLSVGRKSRCVVLKEQPGKIATKTFISNPATSTPTTPITPITTNTPTNTNTNTTTNTSTNVVHTTGNSCGGMGKAARSEPRRSSVSIRRAGRSAARGSLQSEAAARPSGISIHRDPHSKQHLQPKEKVKHQQKQQKQQQSPDKKVQEVPMFVNQSVPENQTLGSESSVDLVETSDFLTRLALEDCIVCLENLQGIVSSLITPNVNGEKQAKGGKVLVGRTGVNPFKLSKRPLVQIAEELSSRLNQLTDRCETYLGIGHTNSDGINENNQENGRNIVQNAEDTFGRAVETQYTMTGTIDEARQEKPPAENVFSTSTFGKMVATHGTCFASTVETTELSDADANSQSRTPVEAGNHGAVNEVFMGLKEGQKPLL
ncbi:uncharacterized protein TM35_000014860 [Trypanosoma theileri]|uniref:Uncharacterized protein n=1 Tax=Trypanosoma theileri TaxID=67003 RepID=A0A1X0PAJ6_9TRYP|nr:uncharacterized protein TM35_000014860 [Trypanosoma theileri]ORC93609.1 hypothetical protein TM35_000014860 [Trypanosoma theileri]